MKTVLRRLSWSILILLALTLGLTPFVPQPHLVEKLLMLSRGELKQMVDIFDLLLHASPFVLLLLKVFSRLF
ncbi:MAG: RND transporter [Desulforhopalus sp.]